MQSFSQALIDLVVKAQRRDQEVAANAATNRHDFLVTVERALKQRRRMCGGHEQAKAEEEQEREPSPSQTRARARARARAPTLRLAQAGD